MKKTKIPKASSASGQEMIRRPNLVVPDGKVTFSFSALERTEYFNLDATCENWSSELFDMLKNASNYSKTELISGILRTYRVHNHENASPPNPLPDGVALKDCYQIRISKSKGGIHGVFNDSVFYVIWLDPLHNMYPSDTHGGLRIITPPTTCCKDMEERIAELESDNKKLQEDCLFWEEEASKAYSQDSSKEV